MKILVLYQDIQSGAKIATESLFSAYQNSYPDDQLVIYKQRANIFTGSFSFVRNTLWSMWDFWKILNHAQNIDLIVSALYTFALPWQLSKNKHVPVIFQVHGDQRFRSVGNKGSTMGSIYHRAIGKLVSCLQSYALWRATRVMFVSRYARDEFLNQMDHASLNEKSVILPNGVDTSIFKPTTSSHKSLLQRGHRNKNGIHIAYVGRIDVKKGIHKLIQTLSYIQSTATLWIAYPTPTDDYSKRYLQQLYALATRSPRRHNIQFTENPTSLVTIYQQSDFLVLPSRQEMFPLVLLEALACGALPLATDVGGVHEILSEISDELVLPSSSPRDIASTIQKILMYTHSHRLALITRGVVIAKRYSWEKAASILRREAFAIIQLE
jgi:glycosyltransferase involved in cell wall biosynthesis